MKKSAFSVVIIVVLFIFSCSSALKGIGDNSRAVLDKTYDYDAIPPAFNKNTAQVLLVSTDFRKKQYRSTLTDIVKNTYKGVSQIVFENDDVDRLYPDTNQYRFVLFEGGIEEIRHSTLNYNDAVGTLTVSYSMYDRVEKKSYPRFFRKNRNWQMSVAYSLEKLNAKMQ